METLSVELVEELRSGRATREKKLAVCTGDAQLSSVDRAEALAVLAADPDAAVAKQAEESALAQPIESFVEAIKRPTATPALFAYASRKLHNKPGIADAMIANKNCKAENLVAVAAMLSVATLKALLDDLDRLTDSSALATALMKNAGLTEVQKSLLREVMNEATLGEAAMAEAAAEAEPDGAKRQTLLQKLGKMTVAQRVQFAIKGGSEARRTLIRDTNKVVQRAVLQSPRLTDQEVETFATMSSLTDEILRLIANNRNFRKNYVVVRNLLNNAKTPLDVSLGMLPLLNPADLKKLTTNKNIPETLRTTAYKLQK
ncbi:MAG: hypothetical protein JO260_08540, partial [Acidobacteria bacterium]|nr:hypothetical protein [Acidobacteriota bacterium]